MNLFILEWCQGELRWQRDVLLRFGADGADGGADFRCDRTRTGALRNVRARVFLTTPTHAPLHAWRQDVLLLLEPLRYARLSRAIN